MRILWSAVLVLGCFAGCSDDAGTAATESPSDRDLGLPDEDTTRPGLADADDGQGGGPPEDGTTDPGTDARSDAVEPSDTTPAPDDGSGTPSDTGPADASDTASPDGTAADAAVDTDVFVCAAETATASPTSRPADIIWVVDNSLSMDLEVEIISEEINRFVSFIGASGVDYQVVMISYDDPTVGDGWYHVCVPPPLSPSTVGRACPVGQDTDGPQYLHVREIVNSREPLQKVISEWAQVQPRLRPDATTHLVAVTDDDSDLGADAFLTQLEALQPGIRARLQVHAVVTQSRAEIDDVFDSCDSPGCPCGAAVGTVYRTLADTTGGQQASICEPDWTPIFDAIAATVVEASAVPCSYVIPDPEGSLSVNPEQVNVFSTVDGTRTLVPNVSGAASCSTLAGWYFDDPSRPTRVELCDASCREISGSIDIEYGCDTVKR